MPITMLDAQTETLTYEQYIAEEESCQRYDILDGVRIYMNPTRRHQRILLNISDGLRAYERATRSGQVLVAPCDVLITRAPLRTRQPDVLFISNEQLSHLPGASDPAPLEVAPELVVEILSPNETRRSRQSKISDYCTAGVKECWVAHPDVETVEVLRLTPGKSEVTGVFTRGGKVQSALFPGLSVAIQDIFAP